MQIVAHLLMRIFLRLLFGFRPPARLEHHQCIVIANHNSHVDIMVLFAMFPLSMIPKIRCMAAADYFSRGIKHWISRRLFNAIAVKRQPGFSHIKPTEPGKQALREGCSIIMFPEGSRGVPGVMADFKSGIGELVVEFPNMPIIEIALKGMEKTLPRGEKLMVPFNIIASVLPPITGRILAEEQNICTRKEITSALEARLKAALDASESSSACKIK
jgi:1-acyl-sn-glycerol-3-phosphate acyltransferase